MLRRRFIIFYLLFSVSICLHAGETPAATQEAQLADTGVKGDIAEYLIDIGDILEISVWGYDELTREVMVRPDGKISYVIVGDITARRQTTVSLAAEIRVKLLDYIKNPNVTVILKKTGDRKIFLLGDVRSPGSYDILQGEDLLEVLSKAGGLTKEASTGEIRIFRKNTSGIDLINFEDVLSGGSLRGSILLQPGDVVYVPQLTKSKGVFIFGEVVESGLYDLKNAPTMLTLIACARGFKATASRSSVRVIRNPANPEVITVNLDRALSRPDSKEDIALQSGDIVYVPRSVVGGISSMASQILPPLQVIYYLNYIIRDIMDLP